MDSLALAEQLDARLRVGEIADWPGALNGLQLESSGPVRKIGAAVDATLPVVEKAVAAGVDFLIVHHGLFWQGAQPVRGAFYRKLKLAMDAGMAVYSAHLPLDLHPEIGNNALLVRALGLSGAVPFFPEKGQLIGQRVTTEIDRTVLAARLGEVLGQPPLLAPGGPAVCREIGIVTGGAGAEVARAAREGIDTFITGEGPHWSHGLAEELGINLFYGGHYATETFGVRALAETLAGELGVMWEFIDHPTGL